MVWEDGVFLSCRTFSGETMRGLHIAGGAAHEDGEEEAVGGRSTGNLRNVTRVPWQAAPDDDIGESMMWTWRMKRSKRGTRETRGGGQASEEDGQARVRRWRNADGRGYHIGLN